MNRFIIATNKATAVQQNAITEHVKAKGWAFWHHFEDFWLVTTGMFDNTTSQQLWTELSDIPVVGKQAFMMVIKASENGQPMTHFGFGPREGWEWTKQFWGTAG